MYSFVCIELEEKVASLESEIKGYQEREQATVAEGEDIHSLLLRTV